MNDQAADDIVCGAINTAWQASSVTDGYPLRFDGMPGDPPTDGSPWGRVTTVVATAGEDVIGGDGNGKYLVEGLVTVDIWTPPGDGYVLARAIGEVVKAAMRGVHTDSSLWFFNVLPAKRGMDQNQLRYAVTAGYRYEDRY